MNANEILKSARALISKPENWLLGHRSNGQGAYCALGALDKAGYSNGLDLIRLGIPTAWRRRRP